MRSAATWIVSLGVAAVVVACTNADDFLGTWEYTAGGVVANCGGGSGGDTLEGTVEITKGTDSALVFTYNDCAVKYDTAVFGGSASVKEAVMCGSTSLGLNVEESTLRLAGEDELSQKESGTAYVFGSSCSYTVDATLTRADAGT